MLYDEFITGTGCKDNEHNYQVYRNLEIMYMNSEMTKAQIYEYGKKLVDNSKSEKQIQIENEIKSEIESLKSEIDYHRREAERYTEYANTEPRNSMYYKIYRDDAKRHKDEIRKLKNKIAMLKSLFEV